ncbi:uncharacterized protein LOC135813643 [Sycon ciliatum]|uniref:uncharacterized protein LOC135813643 n=1 Tax=Sycon ciliatum TaxID=27933 RepID=UPI0031F6613F
MESFRGRKSLSLGGLGQPMANATRRTVVLIVVSIFGSLVFPGHGTAVLAQPCTGGNTIVQTVTSCPPPSEYSTYTVITPTPVVTSPPVTQPPPTTVPPLPPPILIPGLNWHVFSGALLGWSSSLRGVRASIYPWILGNWTQGYTRRLQRAFFMNSSATCFGSTLRCAYQRQVLQTSLSGSVYVLLQVGQYM